MTATVIDAPSKVNLALLLGPLRDDGRHEIASVLVPLLLADSLSISEIDASADEVVCEGVDGPEITAAALAEVRARGLNPPTLRIVVTKRVPVAAGLGGGSADAGALLRWLSARLGPDASEELRSVAAGLGSDVLAQSGLWALEPEPAPCFVSGGGERVDPLISSPPSIEVVLAPAVDGLSAAAVYAEADALGLPRGAEELTSMAEDLREVSGALPLGAEGFAVNDLQAAAISLRPDIELTLVAMERAGAARAMVSGSGPTVVGFIGPDADARAVAAELSLLRPNEPEPIVSALRAGYGRR